MAHDQTTCREIVQTQESFSEEESEASIGTEKVPLVKLKSFISQGSICGSTINPLKVAQDLSEQIEKTGTLYYSTTDNMPRLESSILKMRDFPMNKYATTEEIGPGYVYIVVFEV